MIKYLNSRNPFLYFIICSILNILVAEMKYHTYPVSIDIKNNILGKLYINDTTIDKDKIQDLSTICLQWVPSLFNPIILVPKRIVIEDMSMDYYRDIKSKIYNPIISREDGFKPNLYTSKLFNKYDLIYAKELVSNIISDCYFGLSSGLSNYSQLFQYEINLNKLENNTQISQKIFSFDKCELKNDSIDFPFYFGDEHENFINNNNKGIIGTCKTNEKDPYWGCIFKEMSFNNINTKLINEKDGKNYIIYFSSENHNITFPESFRTKFNTITNNGCKNLTTNEISCEKLFNSENYFTLKLINDNMIITIEIDNILRYSKKKENNQFITNINFEKDEYFILPLIVFKNFHVQFNAENNLISFYTTDKSILELKKENDESPNEEEKEPSNVGTVLLVILIILIIIALAFGVFWFLKKRKNSEQNINKYNKFEEDENFQNMSEKRVF